MGNIIEKLLPDDTTEQFEYDEMGRLVRALSPVGEFHLERDGMGRVIREAQSLLNLLESLP